MGLAWHTAALQRARKMPPLRKLLTRQPGPRPRQTQRQMLDVAKQWTLLLGGKVIDKPK